MSRIQIVAIGIGALLAGGLPWIVSVTFFGW
jgi:hypothetical protein